MPFVPALDQLRDAADPEGDDRAGHRPSPPGGPAAWLRSGRSEAANRRLGKRFRCCGAFRPNARDPEARLRNHLAQFGFHRAFAHQSEVNVRPAAGGCGRPPARTCLGPFSHARRPTNPTSVASGGTPRALAKRGPAALRREFLRIDAVRNNRNASAGTLPRTPVRRLPGRPRSDWCRSAG